MRVLDPQEDQDVDLQLVLLRARSDSLLLNIVWLKYQGLASKTPQALEDPSWLGIEWP